MSISDFIKVCQENVFSGVGITSEDAKNLFGIPEKHIKELAFAANQITREFNGTKVDVEQLNNIKKNSVVRIVLFADNLHFLIQKLNHINYQLQNKL